MSSAGRTADENQSCAERRRETSCVCFYANVSGPQNRWSTASPWHWGMNENTNGLLRQYFHKYTSLDDVSEEKVEAAINALNLRLRKRLGCLSPFEAFFDISLHLTLTIHRLTKESCFIIIQVI